MHDSSTQLSGSPPTHHNAATLLADDQQSPFSHGISERDRAVFNGIGVGIIVANSHGDLLEWNQTALKLHGYSTVEEVRRNLAHFERDFAFYPVEGGPPIPLDQWPLSRGLRREPVIDYELRVHRLDTDQRWVISYDVVWIHSNSSSDAEQVVLTMRDMTARQQVQDDRDQSERHARELIESLPQLVWTCRADGSCDYLSRQWVAYSGIPAVEHLNSGWLNAIHPDDRPLTARSWQAAAREGRPLDVEFRIKRFDGQYRWFKTRAVPLRNAAGEIVRWFGTNTDIHDHRQLADAQAILAAIVEHSDDAIVGKSLDGVITSWNRSAERLFGYRAEEIVGRSIDILLPADRKDEMHFFLNQVRAGKGIDRFKSKRLTKDGRVLDVALTVSPIRDSSGKIVGASKIARDITGDVLAAEALKASETRFRILADAMPQIVWTSTLDGHTSYLNRRWTEFTGLADAKAEAVLDIIHPEDMAKIIVAREAARRAGEPYTMEFRMRHKSGGPYRWFLARGVPVPGASGEVTEWFGTSTDIHDLKQTQELARENEARLRGVLESAVEGIVTLDEQGTIESVNSSVGKAFGYTSEEILGQNVKMLMPEPFAASHDQYLRNFIETGHRKIIGIGREVVGRRKDGSTFPIDLSVSEVQTGGRRIFTGIIRDITARKAAEDRAQERQAELAHLGRVRTMSQMASGLAHELNQPLGAVANYARACRTMVESGRIKTERIASTLAEIQSEALRAGAIINRLRSFVKKDRPTNRPADVNTLVRDAVHLLSFELRNATLEPELKLGRNLPPVYVDHVQIGQVLINLIRNALDAMQSVDVPARRLIMTTSLAEEGFIETSVCDNGCGVPVEALPHIFETFFTTKSTGLGLGLGLCRTIVEDFGGRLTAHPNPNCGMTFTFTLPTSASSGVNL